ncbi:MAG: DNA repair protein RadA [Clostridiales bacterium]|jgi:DNA repair protein RadA/Sms|nr:DNA repair protein RadA [Clostridiales bacterium]
MPKSKAVFICSECAHETSKWYGQCPNCGAWNTMSEEIVFAQSSTSAQKKTSSAIKAVNLIDVRTDAEQRYKTGSPELDRVLGGGLVKGSVVLLGGEPGIGKSTILLQTSDYLGAELNVLYVAGEESVSQIKLRANRLNVSTDKLFIINETNTAAVSEYIETVKPDVVIVDSIQTMSLPDIASTPGSITQVRESASCLQRTAKSLNIPIILVGHVNKDGNIAGPKVLEHIVDAILLFEGERNMAYRILRAIKNRFGSTNEIGVFEMTGSGLQDVVNPSLMFISGRPENASGTSIACIMEGTRPILAEVQGLITKSSFGTPRRTATGFDYNRMAMIIAVMEKRAGLFLGDSDSYINVAGGIRIFDTSADLPVALSLASSFKNAVINHDLIAFGEIGLAGEVRSVQFCEKRVTEALRLGFRHCIVPYHNAVSLPAELKRQINIIAVKTIGEAINVIS